MERVSSEKVDSLSVVRFGNFLLNFTLSTADLIRYISSLKTVL